MDLHQVVSAALQAVDLLIRHALRQAREFFVLAEEIVAVETTVFGGEGLHLAVDRVGEGAHQRAGGVAREQPVPVAAPDQLDHIPAGPRKQLLQLVDDAAVAAHRPVQALQVAVDDPHQVVELFARSQRECAHALGLVHLAIAEHAPDFATLAVLQMAVREVAHEARVVDGADRADAHRAGGELPEVRHQPRVRVAGKTARALGGRGDLLAVVQHVGLAQTAFEKRPCVHAGCAVGLEEHEIALAACAKEMVEAGLEQVGRAGVAGNVTAELAIRLVGAHHHGQRVPAHQRGQPFLHREVAWKGGLVFHRDGVGIGRVELGLPADALLARQACEFVEDLPRPRRTLAGRQRQQGFAPLCCFARVRIGGGGFDEMQLPGNVVHAGFSWIAHCRRLSPAVDRVLRCRRRLARHKILLI